MPAGKSNVAPLAPIFSVPPDREIVPPPVPV
jgi:hypothetical protein